jgi:hypothetical protein
VFVREGSDLSAASKSVPLRAIPSDPGEEFDARLSYTYNPDDPSNSHVDLGTFPNTVSVSLDFVIQRARTPIIQQQPTSAVAQAGGNATFSVTASGANLTFQWRKNGVGIAGATASTYVISNAQPSDAGKYGVEVRNESGFIISTEVDLTVTAQRPVVSVQPLSQTVRNGEPVVLEVAAAGTDLAYQWEHNGAPIPGATTARLALDGKFAAAGFYQVTISNPAGSVTTEGAILRVNPVSRIANLSLLTALGAGEDSFTLGYIVGGLSATNPLAGSKPLLLRAVGPSLRTLGVAGTHDDPRLELYAGTAKSTDNDNWAGAPALAQSMSALGAFPLAGTDSLDAAILAQVTTRDNSAKVLNGASKPAQSGLVIAEIYDATPADSFTVATPRLINVSVLKPLGSGITAGFVIAGAAPEHVLIRAIGPGLAAFGLASGYAADPQLTLFNATGSKLGENNDWGGGATLRDAFSSVGAFTLAADSRDAATMVSLAPGNYSVEVKPQPGSATGLILVEVYELP